MSAPQLSKYKLIMFDVYGTLVMSVAASDCTSSQLKGLPRRIGKLAYSAPLNLS